MPAEGGAGGVFAEDETGGGEAGVAGEPVEGCGGEFLFIEEDGAVGGAGFEEPVLEGREGFAELGLEGGPAVDGGGG